LGAAGCSATRRTVAVTAYPARLPAPGPARSLRRVSHDFRYLAGLLRRRVADLPVPRPRRAVVRHGRAAARLSRSPVEHRWAAGRGDGDPDRGRCRPRRGAGGVADCVHRDQVVRRGLSRVSRRAAVAISRSPDSRAGAVCAGCRGDQRAAGAVPARADRQLDQSERHPVHGVGAAAVHRPAGAAADPVPDRLGDDAVHRCLLHDRLHRARRAGAALAAEPVRRAAHSIAFS